MCHTFRIQNMSWIIQFTIISEWNFQFQNTVELAIYLCGRSFPSRLLPVDSAWLRSNAKTPSWTSNQQSSAPEIIEEKRFLSEKEKRKLHFQILHVFYPVDPSFCRTNYKTPPQKLVSTGILPCEIYLQCRLLTAAQLSSSHHNHQHHASHAQVSTYVLARFFRITKPQQPFFFLSPISSLACWSEMSVLR